MGWARLTIEKGKSVRIERLAHDPWSKANKVPNLSRSHPQHHSSLHHYWKQDRWASFSFFLFQSLTLIAPKPNHGDWIQLKRRRKRWLGRRDHRRGWIGIGFRLVMRLCSKPTPRYHSLSLSLCVTFFKAMPHAQYLSHFYQYLSWQFFFFFGSMPQ